MSWQRKGAFVLLLAVDLFLLYYIIGYYVEKSDLDKWRKQHEKMLSQYREQNTEKEIARLEKHLQGLRGELVLQFEEVDLLNYLTSSAQKNNLYDLKIREQRDRGRGNSSDSKKIFELRAKGSFINLWSYIQSMETGNLPLRLRKLKLSSSKGRVSMEATIFTSSFAKQKDANAFTGSSKETTKKTKEATIEKRSGQAAPSPMQEF